MDKMYLQLSRMSDKQFESLHGETLRLLEDYGLLYEDEEAAALLKRAGNKVDDNGRIHLKPGFVESMIKLIPQDGFKLYGRDESIKLEVAHGKLALRANVGNPFILDYKTHKRREATNNDAIKLTTLTDALSEYTMVHSVVTPFGAPSGIENIRMFVIQHQYSLKPSDITVMTKEEVKTIGQISSAIRGGKKELREKPLTAIDVGVISPLRCAKEQLQAIMEAAKWGIPIEILSHPALGLTSPVTVAGGVTVNMAEYFGALCLIYLIAPGLGVINTSRITPVNMFTTALSFGSPELGMASAIICDMCARYHIPTNLYGFGTNAKTIGAQSQMEKMISCILPCLAGVHMITGGGMLDSALTTSAEQIVIDNENFRFIKRVLKPVDLDKEAIGVDALIEGMNSNHCMISEEHTIKYLKAGEMVRCDLGQWNTYSEWEEKGEHDLVDLAHERVEEILSSHKTADFEPAVRKEIERLMDEAVNVFDRRLS